MLIIEETPGKIFPYLSAEPCSQRWLGQTQLELPRECTNA